MIFFVICFEDLILFSNLWIALVLLQAVYPKAEIQRCIVHPCAWALCEK